MPPGATGRHLVFEATLRPNYLAASYFPEQVLKDLYVVGARPAQAEKVTKTRTQKGQPTRRLLIAGPPRAVNRFAARLAAAPTPATERQWDELRRFSQVSLPRKEAVIVRRPEGVGPSGLTFEAVVTHVGSSWESQQWADEHFQRFAVDRRLYQMLDRVLETLRSKHYPIAVLASGPNESLDDTAEPDRFTAELDVLMKERDITIVCAVGNNGELDSSLGFDRVQPPGDTVNGIGVGAIVASARDPKKRWVRAPYSARGPGREGQRVQPMVVEFGGSQSEPFVGFDERGRLASWAGTSFSTPSVARALGGLQAVLRPGRHIPDIFRVFAAHTAERGYGHGKKYLDLGFGRVPATFDAALECPSHEVTVLYEDQLPRDQLVAMRLPFPKGLPPDTNLEITWTIAFVSDVDPRDATDYTVSGIEAIFRPDARARMLTDPATKASQLVNTDSDRSLVATRLAQGFRLSDEPKAHSGWMLTKGEQKLRRDGKWETIVPGRVLINAAAVHAPRLDLQHLRREGGQLVRGAGVPPLRFAMLATIKAPPGVALYDLVASQYRVLTPLVRVPIRIPGVA